MAKQQNSKGHRPLKPHAINLDDVLRQRAYLVSLDDFLAEADPVKAMSFWLKNFSNIDNLRDIHHIHALIECAISEIDHRVNDQLNVIIHNSSFQKLESSWRGLWYLASQTDGVKNAKLKVLDITWGEIARDISKAMEFDQSHLFQKIYSDEYGMPGGEPYGVIIGDYEIRHKSSKSHPHDDVSTLEGLALICAAAFSPFISGAAPELFGLDHFSDLRLPLNLQAIFAQSEYVRWRSMRTNPNTRFIGLTLPHTLMRLPYRTTPGSYKGVFFYEKHSVTPHNNYLWGNAAYAFGGVLIREYGNVGWFGHIRGVPRDQLGGGLVTNLPCDAFSTDPEGTVPKPVTDVVITDTLEREISNLGFVPLCQCYGTPFVAFYSNPSIQNVKRLNTKADEINAKLSAMLQHVLCASRVAHYIKVIIRDKIGSFVTARDCEDFLRKWLFKYTMGGDDLEWESQARYPLREAQVQVEEHREKPGHYQCKIHLVPHYQADQMMSELELITELVQAGA